MEDWIDLQPSHPNPPEIPLPGTSETKLHVNGGGVGGGHGKYSRNEDKDVPRTVQWVGEVSYQFPK